MTRLVSILALVSIVSFPSLSGCSWICKGQTPVVVVEKIPTYQKLDLPELHEYNFKRLEDGGLAMSAQAFEDLKTDLAALVDHINRYEDLIDEHNKMAENDPANVEEVETE